MYACSPSQPFHPLPIEPNDSSKFQIPAHEIHPLTSFNIERSTCSQMPNLAWLLFTIFITISPSTKSRTLPTQSWKTSKTPNCRLPSIKKVQGIYVISLGDNSSHMEAMKVTFEEGRRADSLRFFGFHQLGLSESHIAGVGCTGRHHGANGLAIVESICERENMNGVL